MRDERQQNTKHKIFKKFSPSSNGLAILEYKLE
jgi:hypothetical protein